MTETKNVKETKNIKEVKKISVEEFVEGYLKISPKVQGAGSRESYVKSIQAVEYVPFLEKVEICTRIARATVEPEERLQVNSPIRYILSVMGILNLYTTLDIRLDSSQDMYEQYDKLAKENLINYILTYAVPEEEYKQFNTILEMTINDLMINNYGTDAIVSNIITTAIEAIGAGASEVFSALVSNN